MFADKGRRSSREASGVRQIEGIPKFLTAGMGFVSSNDRSVTGSAWKLAGLIPIITHIYCMNFKLLLGFDIIVYIVLYQLTDLDVGKESDLFLIQSGCS